MVEIKLRAIERLDLPLMQRWRNSDNVMPYCRQYRPLSMKDMENWYDKLSRDNDYNLTNDLFVITYKDEAIGVGGIVRLDWKNRKGELSFYIGDIQNCTEEIIGSALLSLVEYANSSLGLYKIYFPVYEYNPYLQIYEKFLKREYAAKSEYFYNGRFWDRVVLASYNKIYLGCVQ